MLGDLEYWMTNWLEDIPKTADPTDLYEYFVPEELDPKGVFEEILFASLFINGGFWLDSRVEGAFRSGVFATERDLQRNKDYLKATGGGLFNYDTVFLSREYRTSLSQYQISAKNSIEGIIESTASKMASQVLLAMQAGESPEAIEELLLLALVSMEKQVERVVVTTINQANSQGRMIALTAVAVAFGMEALVEHRSALIPTTRAHHAARHGNIYTVQQQRAWWAKGANRINCYCSVRPVLKR